jgi:hypothetical protein
MRTRGDTQASTYSTPIGLGVTSPLSPTPAPILKSTPRAPESRKLISHRTNNIHPLLQISVLSRHTIPIPHLQRQTVVREQGSKCRTGTQGRSVNGRVGVEKAILCGPLPAGKCFRFRGESAFASAFESTLRVIQQLSDLDGIEGFNNNRSHLIIGQPKDPLL